MTLEELLRDLQGDRTQAEFAAQLGISQPQLSRIYNDLRDPGRRFMTALLREFPSRRDDIVDVFLALDKTDETDPIPDSLEPETAS